MMSLNLVTAPSAEVVSTSDAKDWMRVSTSADDTIIAALSVAARRLCEEFTGRKFISQTWKLEIDGAPDASDDEWWDGVKEGSIRDLSRTGDYIDLLLGPVSSITSVKYYDRDNTESTLSSASYLLDGNSSPSRLCLNAGYSWPSSLRDRRSIAVTMVVGYGASASSVPEPIIVAIKSMIAFLYENRGECDGSKIPSFIQVILEPYVIKRML